MGILHAEIAKLKAHIEGAFNFADPQIRIAELDAEFKTKVADVVHGLETRVDELEATVRAMRTPAEPAPTDTPPAI
jgi:hypothetical protein